MKLKIKAVSDKIGKDIPCPFYATAGAAAMDLCACVDAPVEVAPRALVSIPTGIAIALPSAEYVALDGAVLGKPADELEAFKMLSTLSGCRHQVYTGLTVLRGEERHTVSEETTVAFRELSEEEISCYIQTGEPMDKAGAYGIQGFGALLIEGIQGDYYNVMGLPVCRLGGILRQLGVDCLRLAAGERDSD